MPFPLQQLNFRGVGGAIPSSAPLNVTGNLQIVRRFFTRAELATMHTTPIVMVPALAGVIHNPVSWTVQSSRSVAGGVGSVMRLRWNGIAGAPEAATSISILNNSAPFTLWQTTGAVTVNVKTDQAGVDTTPTASGKALQVDLDATIATAQLTAWVTVAYYDTRSGF